MRVIQVPYVYHPDPIGGTETYVESLSRALERDGVQSIVVAPGVSNAAYEHNGLFVRRFARAVQLDLNAQYGDGDLVAARNFGAMLDADRPDLVHLHAYSSAVSLALLREISARALPIVFTYHTPAVSCLRGSLLRWGEQPCGGELNVSQCTACSLHAHGMPRLFGSVLGILPSGFGRAIGVTGLSGSMFTALRMSSLVDVHHRALTDMLSKVDHIVVVCDWARDVLLLNGVAAERITLSRHGIDSSVPSSAPGPREPSAGSLRLVYLGRIDPIKGLDVVIRALQVAQRDLPVRLDIFGLVQADTGSRYLAELNLLAGNDPRIRFLPAVPAQQVAELLRDYDAVVVPSQCLETGPLVVLEASAAGTPVIGSDLGGLRELVTNGLDGVLVRPPDQPKAWHTAIRTAVEDRDLLRRLRSGIRPPRKMAEVAADMRCLYARLTKTTLPVERAAGG